MFFVRISGTQVYVITHKFACKRLKLTKNLINYLKLSIVVNNCRNERFQEIKPIILEAIERLSGKNVGQIGVAERSAPPIENKIVDFLKKLLQNDMGCYIL